MQNTIGSSHYILFTFKTTFSVVQFPFIGKAIYDSKNKIISRLRLNDSLAEGTYLVRFDSSRQTTH